MTKGKRNKSEYKSEFTEAQLAEARAHYPELVEVIVDERARTHRANLYSHLGKIVYVANAIGSEKNIEYICQTLQDHPGGFEAQERYSIEDLIAACDLAQHYLPLLSKRIKSGLMVGAP